MVDQPDLLNEIPYLERVQLTERLKNAKKQRALQLKGYEQREKRLAKEQAIASKKTSKKNKKSCNSDDSQDTLNGHHPKLRFADSVLMMDAVARNDLEDVKRLLASGVNPDIRGQDGLTALHQSCIDNSVDMVCLLIEAKADINARDMEMWTPMHAVATCGHLKLCQYLCEHGGNLLAMNSDGNMPYDLCEDISTLDFIETEMTRQGVTQELIDETRLGVENTMLADLQKLVDGDVLVEYRGANDETLLHIAACSGFARVTQFLLDHGVPKDIRDNDSWLPIHCAAFWAQPTVVELLLTHGSDPEAATRDGESIIDLCEDSDAKQRIIELVDAVKHKKKLLQILHDRTGVVDKSSARRMSSARRACQRRSSLHDRRDSISLRDLREEAQKFHESLLSGKDDYEDEGEHPSATDASKVMIVISASEPESCSNVDEASRSSQSMITPDTASGGDAELVSQCKISGTTATFVVEAGPNRSRADATVENGSGSLRGFAESPHDAGADDGRHAAKPFNSGNLSSSEIPSLPSPSAADQKKHCGTGCCIVS